MDMNKEYTLLHGTVLKFWQKIRGLSIDNIVIVSELQAPEDFLCIWEKEVSRSIKVSDKSKATEKLFMYRDGKGV